MRLERFKLLFAGLSLLASSCGGSGPLVTVCIVDSVNQGLQCVTPQNEVKFLTLVQAENYVALPPDDMRSLLEYCRLGSKEKTVALSRMADVQQVKHIMSEPYEPRLADLGR